jgi:hypothetical protein
MSITLVLVLALSGSAFARPVDQAGSLEKYMQQDLSGTAREFVGASNPGVFGAAVGGTAFFGGTVWAADSARWEALDPTTTNHVWTFDSGVGSYIKTAAGPVPGDPEVNQFKAVGLHGRMEGWFGIDNSFSAVPYFRRCFSGSPASTELGTHDWTGGVCVGTAAGLGGSYSMWAGVFKDEADALCFAGGQGYGNNWLVCIEHSFPYTGGGVSLGFMYKNDSEPGYDFSYVYVDTSGGGTPREVQAAAYDGVSSSAGTTIALLAGSTLPVVPKPIKIKFCATSDGGWSDQDGRNPTACGAFAVDNVTVTGGSNAYSTNFEVDNGGWTLSTPSPGKGGEWSNLRHMSTLNPLLTPCACALTDSVLVFENSNGGHGIYTDNMAGSPWCDIKAAGLVGAPGKVIRTMVYAELPLLNYMFVWYKAQYYPEVCLNTGKQYQSIWRSPGFIYYFGEVPICPNQGPGQRGHQINMSARIPAGAERIRIALGVISQCQFNADCIIASNATPYFDNAALGVYGTPGAPFIFSDVVGIPQDNFPEDGTLGKTSAGRLDCNDVQGAGQPEVGTSLGDTLVIQGAVGNSEVWAHFRVSPGPGTAADANFTAWYGSHDPSDVEPTDFKMARCDSAERGGTGPQSGIWMTAYHEADPRHGMVGLVPNWDKQIDPADVAPGGGLYRLKNDIFPDNLFTPGTRVDIFYTANKRFQTPKFRAPLTGYYEMEILPSSMDNGSLFNCVLYVDHYNRGAQVYVEAALDTIVGMTSANFEGTNWDRFDVNAESSQQLSFGRPLQTEYGATVVQAIGYKVILWNTGDSDSFCLTREDADVLAPYLTLQGFANRNLYLTGDAVVAAPIQEAASEPSAGGPSGLIQKLVGVNLDVNCSAGIFRDAGCDDAGELEALENCVSLNPVTGSVVANNGTGRAQSHKAWGNGCPQVNGYDVYGLTRTLNFGFSKGDELYSTPTKTADYASATNDGSYTPNPNGLSFKTVAEGSSVHYRWDGSGPCDSGLGGTKSVTERIREVFRYFGYNSKSNPLCDAPAGSTTIPGDEGRQPKFRTSLADFAPNPLVTGAAGRIQFTMARVGRATIDVFDIEGRLVKSVFKGVAQEGINEAFWNGTNEAGTQVASGVYFYRLRSADEDLSKKMVVVRNGGI